MFSSLTVILDLKIEHLSSVLDNNSFNRFSGVLSELYQDITMYSMNFICCRCIKLNKLLL